MTKGIATTVEVWTNEYTVKRHRFNSIREGMRFAREIANGGWHFIGVAREDRKGYCYMAN